MPPAVYSSKSRVTQHQYHLASVLLNNLNIAGTLSWKQIRDHHSILALLLLKPQRAHKSKRTKEKHKIRLSETELEDPT
jgi:hypothetical protein